MIRPGDYIRFDGTPWLEVQSINEGDREVQVLDDGTSDYRFLSDMTGYLPRPSTLSAPSNTMPGMLENDAPETQDPQTPEPEEDEDQDTAWAPPPETISAVTNIAMLAATLAQRDAAEAGRLLRVAAELVDPPGPSALQEWAREALPQFLQGLTATLAQYAMAKTKGPTAAPFDPCLRGPCPLHGYGCREPRPLRPTVTGDIYPDPTGPDALNELMRYHRRHPPEPWPPAGRVVGSSAADSRFRVDGRGNVHDLEGGGLGNGAGGPYLDTYDAKGRAVTLWGDDLEQRAAELQGLSDPKPVP